MIWYSNEEDGLITSPDGRIPSFSKDEALVAYAENLRISLSDETPVLHDLDVVTAWTNDPSPNNVDCVELLAAWNLFGDLARSIPLGSESLFACKEGSLDKIYDKLFWGNNLPAMTPEGEHFDAIWTKDEVVTLSDLMSCGLELFLSARTYAG